MHKDKKTLKKQETSRELKVNYQRQLKRITSLKAKLEQV